MACEHGLNKSESKVRNLTVFLKRLRNFLIRCGRRRLHLRLWACEHLSQMLSFFFFKQRGTETATSYSVIQLLASHFFFLYFLFIQ